MAAIDSLLANDEINVMLYLEIGICSVKERCLHNIQCGCQ
eukprot:COSAG01_NODE_5498_length_4224_cov_2.723152_4_plen_40_part_00